MVRVTKQNKHKLRLNQQTTKNLLLDKDIQKIS